MKKIRATGPGLWRIRGSRPYRLTGEKAVDRNGCTYSLAVDEETQAPFCVCDPTGGMFEYEEVND